MALGIKTSLLASLMGCALLLNVKPASADPITLLRVNFNNVTGLEHPGDIQMVEDILATGQLPAGTSIVGNPNVRRFDDVINTSGGNDGFHDAFTSNFLVLGDNAGRIGGNPSGPNEDTAIRLPFDIPAGAVNIQLRYRVAFNGIDTADNRIDQFLVRVNGDGDAVTVHELSSPFDFGEGTLRSFFDVLTDLDPNTFSPGHYELHFRLNETGNGDGFTNTAVGLDRIRINAEVPSPVPEPGTLLLLGSGLAGLVAWRRQH